MASLLKGLDIEHFLVASRCDEVGRNGIGRMAFTSGGWDYYFVGPAEVQNASERLKPVVKAMGGFFLE